MIRESEVFPIGYISKTRGTIGEVEMNFTDDVFDRSEAEYIILEIDGILVPFFWEEYKFKNNQTAIFKLEDIHDERTSRRLVGCKVFYPTCMVPTEDGLELSSLTALTGFRVTDEDNRTIGTITAVDTSSSNTLLYMETNDHQEIIIPYHDDFLMDYDLSERIIQLHLPEGILELNV